MERKMLLRTLAAVLLTAGCLGTSHASMLLNEVFVNPSGTDNGFEFIELRSSTGGAEAMTGLTLLVIEGEGTAAGTVDQALSLGAFSTGTNGLFLWRDAAAVLVPAPEPATTIHVADFLPDLENGTQAYLLVSGSTAVLGTDYDSDNDGVLDSSLGTLVDAVGYHDVTASGEHAYAGGLGFAEFPVLPTGFDPEAAVRLRSGQWILADVSSPNPAPTTGPWNFDPSETIDPSGALVDTTNFDIQSLTPGGTNPIPEPSSLMLAGLAVLATAGAARRNRIAG